MSKDTLEELDKKGLDLLDDVVEGDIDYSGLIHLISFRHDQSSVFQSTIEPFMVEYDGEWENNNSALRELVLTAYRESGIKADATEISTERIDGLRFQKYEITIYNPDSEVLLKQLMYSKLLNGYDFGVGINYINLADKNEMLKAWRASRFNVVSLPHKQALRQ